MAMHLLMASLAFSRFFFQFSPRFGGVRMRLSVNSLSRVDAVPELAPATRLRQLLGRHLGDYRQHASAQCHGITYERSGVMMVCFGGQPAHGRPALHSSRPARPASYSAPGAVPRRPRRLSR